jgi:hypothetical protein
MGMTSFFALIGGLSGWFLFGVLASMPASMPGSKTDPGIWIVGVATIGALIGLAGHLSWLSKGARTQGTDRIDR